jgi:hypothetical protein
MLTESAQQALEILFVASSAIIFAPCEFFVFDRI